MKSLRALSWLVVIVFLAACDGASRRGSEPVLVAAQTQSPPAGDAFAQINPPAGDWQGVSSAYLELEVASVSRATRQVLETAGAYGGYLINSYTWSDPAGDEVTTLTLAVPPGKFEAAFSGLRRLGVVIGEHRSKTVLSRGDGPVYAQLTVQLWPVSPPGPLTTTPDEDWSPARTFRRAFAVFTAIFQFLADIVIWVAVVAGPFILAGVGAWWLLRRRLPRLPEESE